MLPCECQKSLAPEIVFYYHTFFLECIEDEEENGPYQGKFIGSLNSFHHQVSGKVYAVDEYTFLLSGFNYDGNGADTFFWAGASNRPGPQGFIVPDEYGKYVQCVKQKY